MTDIAKPRLGAGGGNVCSRCGGSLIVIGRTLHPEWSGFELQTLACQECRELTTRRVEAARDNDEAAKPSRRRTPPRYTGL
jgi:hypothetical protein